jgi:hypothetical protein
MSTRSLHEEHVVNPRSRVKGLTRGILMNVIKRHGQIMQQTWVLVLMSDAWACHYVQCCVKAHCV